MLKPAANNALPMKLRLDKQSFRNTWKLLVSTYNGFSNDRGLKLSAALAYYTVFSLGPLLLLLISITGIFFGREAIQGKVFGEINELIGSEGALQVQDMIRNIELSGKTTIAFIIGIVTLLIGATSIFGEIQDSINLIWKVRAKPRHGWVKLLKDRLLSSSIIITLGFLLVVSLIANGVIVALGSFLQSMLPEIAVVLIHIFNIALTFFVVSVLFGVIFKVLPDVKIDWKDVRIGAFFTTFLFMLGRFLIGLYIEKSGTASTFGAAGAVIVILVWVYYTAVILYFGAEFTQVYAESKGQAIQPAEYAVHVEQREIEKEVKYLPPQNN